MKYKTDKQVALSCITVILWPIYNQKGERNLAGWKEKEDKIGSNWDNACENKLYNVVVASVFTDYIM